MSAEDEDAQHSAFQQAEAFQQNAALLVGHALSSAPSAEEDLIEARALSLLCSIVRRLPHGNPPQQSQL